MVLEFVGNCVSAADLVDSNESGWGGYESSEAEAEGEDVVDAEGGGGDAGGLQHAALPPILLRPAPVTSLLLQTSSVIKLCN